MKAIVAILATPALLCLSAPASAEDAEAPCLALLERDVAACDVAIIAETKAPAKARLLTRRAYYLNEHSRYDEAIRDLSEAVRLDPSYASAWHERSYTWGELREFAKAVADSDREVALTPESPQAYQERAFARHGLGDLKGEYDDRSKEVALKPKDGDALLARGRSAIWLGRFDDATRDTEGALGLATAAGDEALRASATAQRGRIERWKARSAGGDPATLCRAADKAGAYDRQDLIGDCSAAFLSAANGPDKAAFLTARSVAWLIAAHDEDSSLADQAVAVALDSGNADWHANLGSSYVRMHHSWAGLRELNLALAIKENWPALAERAVARYNLHDSKGAFEDASRAYKLHENDLSLTVLGDLAKDRGDKASAKLYWMGAYHLGSRDDGLIERLKAVGVEHPEQEPAAK
jgi:tetratricopeptide (TPR) repeat protein